MRNVVFVIQAIIHGGVFFKRSNLAFLPYWSGWWTVTGKKMKERQWCDRGGGLERWTWEVEDPAYSGSKGHPEVLKRLPTEWQVAHFHNSVEAQGEGITVSFCLPDNEGTLCLIMFGNKNPPRISCSFLKSEGFGLINSALTYLLNTTGNASLGFNVQGLDLLNEGFLILAL